MIIKLKTTKTNYLVETMNGTYIREEFLSETTNKVEWYDINKTSKITGKNKSVCKTLYTQLENKFKKTLFN